MDEITGKMRFPEPPRFVVQRIEYAVDLDNTARLFPGQRADPAVQRAADLVFARLWIPGERRYGAQENAPRLQSGAERGDESAVVLHPLIMRRGIRGDHGPEDPVRAVLLPRKLCRKQHHLLAQSENHLR